MPMHFPVHFPRETAGLTGMTFKGLKKYPHVVPFLVLTGGGFVMASFFMARAMMLSPDVVVDKSHPEPWNNYRNKNYNLVQVHKEVPPCPAPEY